MTKESFNDFEHAAWERKADRYEETWGAVTSQVIPTALDVAEISAGARLLDCGCGAGHLCRLARERGAVVTGCDFSVEMLKIAQAAHPDIEFVRQDAEALTFGDESFDIVILNYLLLHVADQIAVLREAYRVLKPGGRLVFTVWLPPAESTGLNLIFSALRAHADMSVIPPGPDIFLLASEGAARNHLAPLGFSSIRAQRFASVWRMDSAEHFFEAIQAGTRMGGLVELQKDAVKAAILDQVRREIEPFRAADGYLLPTPSLVVSAAKL